LVAANFLECAVAMFVILGCLPFVQNDDINGVTKKVNGGSNGLPDRQLWLTRWKAALGVP
jgi:putative chitinase